MTQTKPRKLKGGTIDIETYPGSYRSFADNMYEAVLMKETQPVKLASFSYKELGKKKVYTRGEWQYKNYKEFVKDMHRVFKENDFLIGHNAKNFDLKQSNAFFASQGLSNTDTEIVDTLKIVKQNFRLPSYRLKYCLVFFGIGEKMETGGESLWFATEAGDRKARAKFLEYNENDTVQTELLYLYMQDHGWVKKVPGQKLYIPGEGCWRCGNDDTQKRGLKPRVSGFVQEFMCKLCGQRLYTSVVKSYNK